MVRKHCASQIIPAVRYIHYYKQDVNSKNLTGGVDYISGPHDYVGGPYAVKFPAGITKVTLNVTIMNDMILENNETFKLSINSNSLSNRVTVEDPSGVNVTIVDNDSKLIKC